MADNEKLTVGAVFSAFTDYTRPKNELEPVEITGTPSYVVCGERTAPTGGITLLEAGEWTTLNTLVVKNDDATNFVTVGYTDAAADAQTVDVLAGGIFVTQDVDPATAVTLTADTAACDVKVYASGA